MFLTLTKASTIETYDYYWMTLGFTPRKKPNQILPKCLSLTTDSLVILDFSVNSIHVLLSRASLTFNPNPV